MTRDEPAPPHIPDYQLLRKIGQGSYGVVWLAQSVTGLYRAVKIVWRASFEDPQPYEREFRGIKEFAAVSLVEPRQLALLHVGRNDAEGFFYYVMELADDATTGREIDPEKYVPYTLRELRTQRGRLPADETLTLAVDLAGALAGLHAHNLVHRDIKPSNIIYVGGVPKLADIGLVTSVATTDVTISRVGNPGYMPPDFPGVPSADVYGLAKVLYELATGRSRDDYPRLPADLDTLPDRKGVLELNEIFVRACAPNPEKRYPNAGALRDDLLLLQAGKSVRRLRAAERHLGRALKVAAMLAIAVALASTGAWIEYRRAGAAERERDLLARRSVYTAGLARAQRALETANVGIARRILEEIAVTAAQAGLRGFEWDALMGDTAGDPADTVRGDGMAIRSLHLSPDKRLLVSTSDGQSATVLDAASLSQVKRIAGVRTLAGFSRDGKWLIGADGKTGLMRWDVESGAPDPETASSSDTEWPFGVNAADEVLTVSLEHGATMPVLRAWNFQRRAESTRIPLGPATSMHRLVTLRPLADSTLRRCVIVTAPPVNSPATTWRVQVFDLAAGRAVYDEHLLDRPTAVALSTGANLLAIGFANSGKLRIHDLESAGAALIETDVPISNINTLAFSPDCAQLAIGGQANFVALVRTVDGRAVRTYRGHDLGVNHLAWIAESHLISGGTAGDLRRWHYAQPARREHVTGAWASSRDRLRACVSADGRWVAARNQENTFQIVSLADAGTALEVPGFLPLAFEPDGSVWAMTREGELGRHVRDGSSRASPAIPLLEQHAKVIDAAMSANRKRTVIAATDGSVRIYDRDQGNVLRGMVRPGVLSWVTLDQTGSCAISGGLDQTTRVWRVGTAHPVAEWRGVPRATSAAFDPSNRILAQCFRNGEVEIRSAGDLSVITRFKTDSAELWCIAFSNDGRRLFCGGANSTVWVYDTKTWEPIMALAASSPPLNTATPIGSIAFSTDSSTLLAYQEDGRIRVWSAGR